MRGNHLACGERLEDRIRDGEDERRTGADHERVMTVGGDGPRCILNLAVVAEVIGAEVDRRQPEQFGVVELRGGQADSRGGEPNIDRFSAGKLQGAREVDRQRLVARHLLGNHRMPAVGSAAGGGGNWFGCCCSGAGPGRKSAI